MALSAAQVRTHVLAALTRALRGPPGATSRTFGGRLLRRGAFLIADTDVGGVLVLATIERSNDGVGVGTLLGPGATVRSAAPAALRSAWLAGDSDEQDADP